MKKIKLFVLIPLMFLCSCDIAITAPIQPEQTEPKSDTTISVPDSDSKIVTHNVRFLYKKGTSLTTATVIDGSDNYIKPDPTYSGYIFDCWCIDKELTTEFDFSTDISEDITLYAKYYIDYAALTNLITIETMKANITVFNTGISSMSTGSGIIFDEDSSNYYALTNNHVIYSANASASYAIEDYLGNRYPATVLAADPAYDLAVVKFRKSRTSLFVLEFENENPEISTQIVALGQPEGQTNAITYGTIEEYSTTALVANVNESNVKFETIQHSAYIRSGSSGGALLNTDLKIVGINYAERISNSGAHESSRSIPVLKVLEFLEINHLK